MKFILQALFVLSALYLLIAVGFFFIVVIVKNLFWAMAYLFLTILMGVVLMITVIYDGVKDIFRKAKRDTLELFEKSKGDI